MSDLRNTTLVVMAAGMGSRFGGLKQAEPITADGRCILDFSVYDAKSAGFDKVVFIIRPDMEEDFKRLVGDRISKTIKTEYVYQHSDRMPIGRTKPLGTGHAILCCRDAVKEPFAIINADDYYGRNAFVEMHDHLVNAGKGDYAMIAYHLGNTLSKNGTVSRGVCGISNGYMESVTEVFKIAPDGSCEWQGEQTVLPSDTPVSMNLWGLTPDIFELLESEFDIWMNTADIQKEEFYIPMVIFTAIKKKIATVKVYSNTDQWYGITYRDDLPQVKEAIGKYVEEGLYD